MKKIIASLVMITSFAFAANAQNTDTAWHNKMNAHNEHHGHKGMMSQLNLTEDQKTQLKAYNEEFRKQEQELNKNESITVKEFRDKKYALKQERKAKFESLLTPEQKEKLKQLKLQHQQQHEMMAAKRLDKMKMKLGLSDDQVAQLKAQQKEMHDKLMAIKENENLSRTDKKEQLEALRTESKDNFKKILTPDQLNKMEEFRKNRMEKNSAD
jgi:Spy/CpxP family protein refolding chaperone